MLAADAFVLGSQRHSGGVEVLSFFDFVRSSPFYLEHLREDHLEEDSLSCQSASSPHSKEKLILSRALTQTKTDHISLTRAGNLNTPDRAKRVSAGLATSVTSLKQLSERNGSSWSLGAPQFACSFCSVVVDGLISGFFPWILMGWLHWRASSVQTRTVGPGEGTAYGLSALVSWGLTKR